MSQLALSPTDVISPRLLRLPAIDPEPPFDDEIQPDDESHHELGGQGALSLVFALPNGLPTVPTVESTEFRLRLVHPTERSTIENPDNCQPRRSRRMSSSTLDEEFGPQPTARAQLPEPEPWAARLVQAVIEVRAGARPASQLIRWTNSSVYEAISRRPLDTTFSAPSNGNGRRRSEIVRSVRTSEPVDGVVEVSAVVQRGPRCRAIALRLEGIDGRWQCTALVVG